MNTNSFQSLFIVCCATAAVAIAQPAVQQPDVAAVQRALYPNGLLPCRNAITEANEKPEFVLAAEARLPDSNRHVIVFAERLSRDLPFDKIYTVYIAVVERRGEALVVLDRRNVTEAITLFTEFPGNFLELRALVTPLPTGKKALVSVELWATLHGSGSVARATHLFYDISEKGKLEQVLDLDATYASGRSGDETSSKISTVAIAPNADGGGDVLVRSRAVTWSSDEDDAEPQCGPVSLSRYRFDGTKFQKMDAASGLPDNAFVLPRLDVEETDTCDHPAPKPAAPEDPTG